MTILTYVKPDVRLEVQYVQDSGNDILDTPIYKWYSGKIKSIKYKDDDLVECDIEFDDGETVWNTMLFKDDYDREWRLQSEFSPILKALVDLEKRIDKLEISDAQVDESPVKELEDAAPLRLPDISVSMLHLSVSCLCLIVAVKVAMFNWQLTCV